MSQLSLFTEVSFSSTCKFKFLMILETVGEPLRCCRELTSINRYPRLIYQVRSTNLSIIVVSLFCRFLCSSTSSAADLIIFFIKQTLFDSIHNTYVELNVYINRQIFHQKVRKIYMLVLHHSNLLILLIKDWIEMSCASFYFLFFFK